MTSSYIWVALLSAGIFGMVTVLDKRLASYDMPSLPAFYMGVMIALFSYATISLVLTGIPEDAPLGRLIATGVSGLCWGGALGLMFWGYKLEEASRASAICVAIEPARLAGMAPSPSRYFRVCPS